MSFLPPFTPSREAEIELARVTRWLRLEASRLDASVEPTLAAAAQYPDLVAAAEQWTAESRALAHGFRVAATNLEGHKHREESGL